MPLYIGVERHFDQFSQKELKFVSSFTLGLLACAAGIARIGSTSNDFWRFRVTLELKGDGMFQNWYLEEVRTILTESLVVRMRDAGWSINHVNESKMEWWDRMVSTCSSQDGRLEALRAYAPPVVTPAKLEILCAKQLWLQKRWHKMPEEAETALKRLESVLSLSKCKAYFERHGITLRQKRPNDGASGQQAKRLR